MNFFKKVISITISLPVVFSQISNYASAMNNPIFRITKVPHNYFYCMFPTLKRCSKCNTDLKKLTGVPCQKGIENWAKRTTFSGNKWLGLMVASRPNEILCEGCFGNDLNRQMSALTDGIVQDEPNKLKFKSPVIFPYRSSMQVLDTGDVRYECPICFVQKDLRANSRCGECTYCQNLICNDCLNDYLDYNNVNQQQKRGTFLRCPYCRRDSLLFFNPKMIKEKVVEVDLAIINQNNNGNPTRIQKKLADECLKANRLYGCRL